MTRIRLGDWVLQPPWTVQRALGLKVLATYGAANISTVFPTSVATRSIFQLTAVFLERRGLATIDKDGDTATLTEWGYRFVQALDTRTFA